MGKFQVGERVEHPELGKGSAIRTDDQTFSVDFQGMVVQFTCWGQEVTDNPVTRL